MDIRSSLKNNPPFLLVVLLAVHLLVVLLNPSPNRVGRTFGAQILMTIYQPFQDFLVFASSGVGGMREKYLSLRDARAENQQLKETLAKLETEKAKLQDDVKLAESVSKLGNWRVQAASGVLPALVIARDATSWYRTITINKGSISGVEKDQPVIADQGLVGRVITVSPNAARILLLTEERHAAGAAIGQGVDSRILGVVQGASNSYGKNNARLELKLVGGVSEKPQVGEWIFTSGQEGFYPKGIPIGKVVPALNAVEASPDVVPIEPAAPLNQLDVVGVILVSKEQIRAQVEELNRAEREKERLEQEAEKKQRELEQQKKKQTE